MFDVFKFARLAKASKSTTVKAYGAKAKVEGLCEDVSVDGLAGFIADAKHDITWQLPKQDITDNVGFTGRLANMKPDEAALLVLGQYPEGDEEVKGKAKRGRKAKDDVATEEIAATV